MAANDASSKGKMMWFGLGVVILLAAIGWMAMGSPEEAASTDPKAPGREHTTVAAPQHLAGPPANLPAPPDTGDPAIAQAEHVPPETPLPPPPAPVDDAPNQGDGDGPEVAPFAIPNVESRVEREMSWGEKAGQTRVMITRIDERVTHEEERLAAARESGDDAHIHLQEVLLQRLRQRSGQLAQQAAHEEEQAAQEATDGPAEPEDAPPDPSQAP